MALTIVITDAGRAAIVNAVNTGTDPVVIAEIGVSATAIVAAPAATALTGEIKRLATIAGGVVAEDTIHLTIRDETADTYDLRSFALYLGDGTLFGLYGQPDPIIEKSAQALLLLAVDVIFADIDAATITFGDISFINPPATTTVQGVVELATEAEAETGTDHTRAVTPKGLLAAVTAWLNTRFGVGAPSAFFKGLMTAGTASALRTAIGLTSPATKTEGAGGGLDADLLDGQQGSWYSAIAARLGYTPANRAGDTFTGAVLGQSSSTWTATVAIRAAGAEGGQIVLGYVGNTSLVGQDNNTWNIDVPSLNQFRIFRIGASGGIVTAMLVNEAGTSIDFSASAISAGGNTMWTAGNDGAGSGLDADLLDGQQGSYYTNIPARLGYSPANKAGDTFTDAMTFANLAGFYLNKYAGENPLINFDATDFVWFDRGGNNLNFIIGASTRVTIGPSSTAFNSPVAISGVLTVQGSTAWHAGNDGSGSGLDADLLDGYQASAFDRIVSSSIGQDGYIVYASGLKIIWGRVSVSQDSLSSVTYPISFDTIPTPVFPTMDIQLTNAQQNTQLQTYTATGFTVYQAADRSASLPYHVIGK